MRGLEGRVHDLRKDRRTDQYQLQQASELSTKLRQPVADPEVQRLAKEAASAFAAASSALADELAAAQKQSIEEYRAAQQRRAGALAPMDDLLIRAGLLRRFEPDFLRGARLPPAQIQAVMRGNYYRFQPCYEAGLARDPELRGKVHIHFVITPERTIEDVEARAPLDPTASPVNQFVLDMSGKQRTRFPPMLDSSVLACIPSPCTISGFRGRTGE